MEVQQKKLLLENSLYIEIVLKTVKPHTIKLWQSSLENGILFFTSEDNSFASLILKFIMRIVICFS